MNRVRVNALLLVVAASLLAEAGLAAGQPASWIAELPSVDQVKKSTPGGKDERDTIIRQSAALVVWQDVIEAFTKKSFFDFMNADRAAPEVKRYFEYSAASTVDHRQGHAVDAVIAYSDTFPFRQEVIARFLSASSLRAYWDLRRAELSARQARHKAFETSQAPLDQFPTVEMVMREMKGVGARDTAGRTEAAFQWLAVFADALASGRSLAGKYSDARNQLLASNPEGCSQETGCVPQNAGGGLSRFYWCRASYEGSAQFAHALFEKYVPKDLKNQIAAQLPMAGGKVWGYARLVTAGLPLPDASSVCTTTGQVNGCQVVTELVVQRDKILKDYARRQRGLAVQQRKDELAKQVRPPEVLADVTDAHDHRQSLSVYDVNLGDPLAVSVCLDDEANGRGIRLGPDGCPDDGLSQGIHISAKPDVGLEHALRALTGAPLPPVEQTCAAGADPLDPANIDSTVVNLFGAFVPTGVSATNLRVTQVKRPSWLHSFRLPIALERNGFVVAVSAETQGPGVEEAALKDLEREYGPASRPRTKEMSGHQRDWFLHGLHVVYGESSVLYELEGFHKERIKTAGERWPIVSAHGPAGAVRSAPLPGQSYQDFLSEQRAHRKAERLEQLNQDQIDLEGTGVTTPEQQQEQTRIDQDRQELGQ